MRILEPTQTTIEPLGKVDHALAMALLEDFSLTYTKIGKQLGCSREYVRQIDIKRRHDTGQQRKVLRKIDKLRRWWQAVPFYMEAAKRGLELGLIGSKLELLVNGKSVRCGVGCWHFIKHKNYLHVHRPYSEAEIFVWHLADTGKYLILPSHLANFKSTCFSLEENNENKRRGAYSVQHHYRQYIDAWHVFQNQAAG